MRIKYFTIVLFSVICFAQIKVPPMGRGAIQNALLMERKGDLKEAQKIYESILTTKPKNRQAYTRLKNIYKRLGDYKSAAELINNWLQHSPHDLQQHVELGEIFFTSGNDKEASEVWNNLIAQYGQNSSVYRMLIHTYSRMGLAEKMQEMVRIGRERFNDPAFMALDLGNYYQSRQHIANAVSEFLIYAKHNPKQLKLINDNILIMSDDIENVEIIESSLTIHLDRSPLIVHSLLSSLYFKIGSYQQSVDHQFLIADDQSVRLNRLNIFANNLRKERQFDFAVLTYQTIISDIRSLPDKIDSKKLGKVLLGLGRVYEDQIQPHKFNNSLILNEINNAFFNSQFNLQKTISTDALEQALSMYNTILDDLKSTSFSPQAHFRLGEIQFNILMDIDGAYAAYTAALSANPGLELSFKIHSRLVDILIAEGKIEEGQVYLQNLPISFINRYKNEIAVMSIQISLYNGRIDSTLKILDELLVNMVPTDNQFNDFMELQAIINMHYTDGDDGNKEAFQQYLSGEMLLKQNKLSEAVLIFSTIRENQNSASIAKLASTREIFTLLQMNQFDEAMIRLNWLLTSDAGDKGLILAGEIFQYIRNDQQKALNYYEQLLEDYPQSFLFEPIRQRVRILKAETES
ncbi:MAG: tetratricopeptide repeat protein [Candidatus Marinimicrobia bacterium]|nr:tetratricopeptide repeat protein [Candidatus Neomarinimicrobiota bacterium]